MTPARMTEAEYRAIPALSYSSLKDLAVSPTRFWHLNVRPDREPEEETPALIFGSALHAAVLEPDAFLDRYAREIDPEDFPGCLTTADTLKEHIRSRGGTPKGTTKAGWIEQIRSFDRTVPILSEMEAQSFAQNKGKTVLKVAEWDRVYAAAKALRDEPNVQDLLSQGEAEKIYMVKDPETGVQLKARMDWVRPEATADLKTFSQQRGKSIDQTVADAVFYEKYHWQGWLYSHIRSIAEGKAGVSGAQTAPPFMLCFVESEAPHETRIRLLRAKAAGSPSLLWESARIECRRLIRLYADCLAEFGTEKPWRWAQEMTAVADEEIRGLSYV